MERTESAQEDRAARKAAAAAFRRSLGRRIRRLRTERGLSQERLALEAGLTQYQVSGVETARRNPSATTLWAIAGALSVSLADLVAGVR